MKLVKIISKYVDKRFVDADEIRNTKFVASFSITMKGKRLAEANCESFVVHICYSIHSYVIFRTFVNG